MRSYYFKNFITLAALVLLSFLILSASFVLVGRNYALRERQETLESNAIELSRLASAYARDGALEDWSFRITLSTVARSTGNLCLVADTDGTVVTCSDITLGCDHVGMRLPENVMSGLRERNYFSGLAALGEGDPAHSYMAALPVVSQTGEVLAYVFAVSSVSGVIEAWRSILNIFLVMSLIIMAAALVIGFFSAKVRAKPINEMAEAARKFAHGDFSARVSAGDRDDEIGALADAFNQMAEGLEQSERRRADFIANVAHELKTPMTTISGFADGILDGTIPKEKEDQYLATISSETKRLNRLVRSMLELSRIQSGSPAELRAKSFDATELLAQTLILFESKINEKRLEVDAQFPEDPMLVCGDRDAINQVMYNLLENAVKFSDPGTTLGVALFKQGGKAYVSIKNHGPTIPEEELPLIFDRFHKTDKSRSMDRDGCGLGLYIVKTILGNHGEDIAVSSRDGVTEFTFSLTLKTK